MIDFIFKYTWIGMIVLVYIIWSVKSIKDIIHVKRVWKDEFEMDMLDESTSTWIITTLVAIFAASFVHWLFGGAE